MIRLKLTTAQRSAVEIYVTDPVHAEDYPEAALQYGHGWYLVLDCTTERAREILIDAANGADGGLDPHARSGGEPIRDPGACRALSNLVTKLRTL